MKTIAQKVVGDFRVQITEVPGHWNGKVAYVVDKVFLPDLKQVALKRFFNKESAARFGRGLIREMGH